MVQDQMEVEKKPDNAERSGVFGNLFSSPYHFTVAAFLASIAIALWYVESQLEPRLDRQSEDTRNVSLKIDKLTDTVQDLRIVLAEKESTAASGIATLAGQINNSQTQTLQIKDQLAQLSLEIKTGNADIGDQFAVLQQTIEDDIKIVEEKTNSTEQKIEETLANIPETENMANQLVQQKTAIENTGRGVSLLNILVELGIEHPLQRQTLLSFAESNTEFSENPDRLATLWESRTNYTKPKFVEYMQSQFSITPTAAMILAYDELTESKPIRFFVERQEIQSSAEPLLGAAIAETEQSTVPLAKPLTIARVCSEIPRKSTFECYSYFLKLSANIGDDVISFDAPSDNAVMKLIVGKHSSKIPNE